LERDDSDSIVVAATNFVGMLDEALFRRFDDVIEYDLPDEGTVRRLIQNRLAAFDLDDVKWEAIKVAARDLSHAEVARACDDAARGAIMAGGRVITNKSLTQALKNRGGMRTSRFRKKQQDD
jgi:SpoVK/Ycf46/Vps4 family AAA+-type ATPase